MKLHGIISIFYTVSNDYINNFVLMTSSCDILCGICFCESGSLCTSPGIAIHYRIEYVIQPPGPFISDYAIEFVPCVGFIIVADPDDCNVELL